MIVDGSQQMPLNYKHGEQRTAISSRSANAVVIGVLYV